MRFALAAFVCAASLCSLPAAADSTLTAMNLGNVLASENACGLSYDQSAIAAFIEKNVEADDMGFPSTLQLMTVGAEVGLKDMSQSEVTAHCTQIRRLAKAYGFTAP